MTQFPVNIVQVFKATRVITVFVEADDQASAVEDVSSGAVGTPEFDNPDWSTSWDLQNEEVSADDTTT